MSGTKGRAASRAGDPWLLVIDPQRIFADADSPWGSPFFPEAMEHTARLAAAVGPGRTVVTRWLPTADRDTSWGDYFAAWPHADVPATDARFDLVPEARGLSSGPTVDLPTFGKWGTPLAGIVGQAPRLLVAGVSTDCCVISTVLAAADAGAHIDVVTDACAASTTEDGAAALQVMGLFAPQVRLVTSAEVLAPTP